MPNYTSNHNLVKPLPTELYDVEVFNGNMDVVDAALNSALGLKSLTSVSLTDTAIAQADNSTRHYSLGGGSYKGDDLPHSNDKYSTATIFKRSGAATIVLWGSSARHRVAIKYYSSSSQTWTDWIHLYTTEYLPTSDMLGVPNASGSGKTIFGSNDLDIWTYPGFYSAVYSASDPIVNAPAEAGTTSGTVLVLGAKSTPARMTQIFIPFGGTKIGVLYTRICDNGTWGEWYTLYSTRNKPYTYGTTDLTAGTSELATGEVYLVYE